MHTIDNSIYCVAWKPLHESNVLVLTVNACMNVSVLSDDGRDLTTTSLSKEKCVLQIPEHRVQHVQPHRREWERYAALCVCVRFCVRMGICVRTDAHLIWLLS